MIGAAVVIGVNVSKIKSKRKGCVVEPLWKTAVLSSSIVLIVRARDKFASDLPRGLASFVDILAPGPHVSSRGAGRATSTVGSAMRQRTTGMSGREAHRLLDWATAPTPAMCD